jgi:hypothetical protein
LGIENRFFVSALSSLFFSPPNSTHAELLLHHYHAFFYVSIEGENRAMSRTTLTRGIGNRRHLDVCLCRHRVIRLRDYLLTSENSKLLNKNGLNSLKKMANFVPVLDLEFFGSQRKKKQNSISFSLSRACVPKLQVATVSRTSSHH